MSRSKSSISFVLLFLITLFPLGIFALTPHSSTRDEFDDLIELVDSQEVSDLITNSNSVQVTRRASKEDIITLLSDLEIIPLLQENFFLRTNNLNTRSLLDYPEFIPFRHDRDKRAIYVDLFFNQRSRSNFTKGSSNICSYLGISHASFVQKLENVIAQVQNLDPDLVIDVDKITRLIELVQTFTVQERRLGLMIGGKTTFNRWHFNIMAPWYYLERNHFVNKNVEENLEALVADILEETLGVAKLTPAEMKLAEKQKNAFIDQHFISDKLGIGDTRIYLDHPFIKKKYFSSRIGVLATIPTAFAFKKGLKGTSFNRIKNRPTLNLVDIMTMAMPPQKQFAQEAYDFGLAAFDNINAILLDSPMGNGGHFGLGVFGRYRSPLSGFIQQDWARRFVMRSFISLEYLFPAVEWRSFRVPVNEALFNAVNFSNTSNQVVINDNFAFLVHQITDRFFPIAILTRVNPGCVFRWSSQMCYEGDTAGFTLGTDTYVKNKERFSKVYATQVTKNMIDILNARAPFSYQSKVVGSVFFKVDKPDRLYTIALIGDYTMMNKGIGADFTMALNFDVTF